MPPLPAVEPIRDADLAEFAAFLRRNLDPRVSVETWLAAFQHGWAADKPNNGFLVRSEGEIVGAIGAIYSDQRIRGETERFCNITSWCVLEPHRAQSMRLAMALVSQPGFHFTDLTPTDVVKGALGFLKFKEMDPHFSVIPNLPRPRQAGVRVVADPTEIERVLPPDAARAYRDHRQLPWISHVAIGDEGGFCHVAFKRSRVMALPSATLLALSDPQVFLRCHRALTPYLLREFRVLVTSVETRLLPERPRSSWQRRSAQTRMFRSETLDEADITNLYTERVALDI